MDAITDHHSHLFSPITSEHLSLEIGKRMPPFTARELAVVLDRDVVDRAAVLSVAYMLSADDDGRAVAAENDWVAAETDADDRLVAFFSVDPLRATAVAEVNRCAALASFRGLKIHLANSGVNLRDVNHREAVRRVLAAANGYGMPIVIHLRSSREAGAEEAQLFTEQVLPGAGDVAVQVAHLGGWGGFDDETVGAFSVLARQVELVPGQALFLDVSAVLKGGARHQWVGVAEQLRTIAADRILFGTDWPDWTPRAYLRDLAEAGLDIDTLITNRAPWMH